MAASATFLSFAAFMTGSFATQVTQSSKESASNGLLMVAPLPTAQAITSSMMLKVRLLTHHITTTISKRKLIAILPRLSGMSAFWRFSGTSKMFL